MNIHTQGSDLVITEISDFDICQIFDCGQCFRFELIHDDSGDHVSGVAFGRYLCMHQPKSGVLIIDNCSEAEFNATLRHFLALDIDYSEIKNDVLAHFTNDITMKNAIECGKGIRILRQEPWETLISFIISQNNNIPRIKKIISEMSKAYGHEIEYSRAGKTEIFYAFPTPEALVNAGIEGLAALKTGFRAKYIYDAAFKVAFGKLNLSGINEMDTPYALKALMEINGVGPKVASCAALFAFDKTDAFPIDVWIKRVLEKYYPTGLDINGLGKYAGIAQQYLFYYERYVNEGKK